MTVVVPVRDRTDGVARLLAGLRADPDTAGVPVLVVDDGSADASALAAVAEEAGADVLRSDVSRGPAAARNTGLRAARTPLVAFLDSDCVPRPGWLPPLRRHLGDPRLALVAPRVVALERSRSSAGTAAGRLRRGWRRTRRRSARWTWAPGRPPSARSPPSPTCPAPRCWPAGTRSATASTSRCGWPRTSTSCWRLVAAGWRVRYEPAAEVAHEHPAAVGPWLRRRAFYGTGAALLARRHGAAVAPVVVSPWSAAALALAAGRAAAGPARRRPASSPARRCGWPAG